MDIEELAFKDRKTLAQLNEKDLLDIIVFLQLDRKQWINQFSKTHNESVDIQKENQELKKQLDKYENPEDMTLMMMWCTEKVKDENKALKKQVENYKKLGFKHLVDKNNNLETQQKEFIKWLEDEISKQKNDIFANALTSEDIVLYIMKIKLQVLEEILQKYKSIIGNDINVGSKGGNKDE